MLYELRADTGAARLVDAPAHQRGKLPACLRTWAGETWLPSVPTATYCEVWQVLPLTLRDGYPYCAAALGSCTLLGHVPTARADDAPAPPVPRLDLDTPF